MKILGIEKSCDETAAAVVEDGRRLLSNVVSSQIDIHAQYGGVVPEVAARSHVEVINPVINQALSDANLTWDDIDAIAVTYAPGLIGSLLIGTLVARTLALIKNKPLYPIHHVEAHVYANFITEKGAGSVEPPLAAKSTETSAAQVSPAAYARETRREAVSGDFGGKKARTDKLAGLILPKEQPQFPLLALIVSGGHTQLTLVRGHGDYELVGRTQDDAAGEAFDKVAKILGLPYPGGLSISKAAEQGDPHKYNLPKAKLAGEYDFSFSGLKTAVLRAVQREVGVDITFPSYELAARLNEQQRNDFAASFMKTANETLVDKTVAAFSEYRPKSVVIAGGVAADPDLRQRLADRLPVDIEYAPRQICTDNAAMIATLGYYYSLDRPPIDPRDLEVAPSLSMTKTAWAEGRA
jgi:N6-L-threonylcarbamoyladenine synthase